MLAFIDYSLFLLYKFLMDVIHNGCKVCKWTVYLNIGIECFSGQYHNGCKVCKWTVYLNIGIECFSGQFT